METRGVTLSLDDMQGDIERLAQRRGMSTSALCVLFIRRELGHAQDDAYRRAMQNARDEGYPGSFAEYLKEHPNCCAEELR